MTGLICVSESWRGYHCSRPARGVYVLAVSPLRALQQAMYDVGYL